MDIIMFHKLLSIRVHRSVLDKWIHQCFWNARKSCVTYGISPIDLIEQVHIAYRLYIGLYK